MKGSITGASTLRKVYAALAGMQGYLQKIIVFMPEHNFAVEKGWVMVKADGTIWLATFAKTNAMCWALAIETWALDGETKKDHPEWRPMQGFMTVVLL